ncbi:hypothetical protein J437_LFUL002495 [Ladona fulva]|uniref:COMM domain-containing protein 5 n=1 Tax=Ladona fulva TaxID=123851 RepID=A0A8K0JT36_LADFU|nr:hypothetical protein J437_LFUL002495 [Ladona fulva]
MPLVVVNAIEGRVTQDGCLDKIKRQCLLQKGQQAPENLDELYAGIHTVVHAFLRLGPGTLKPEVFENDLRDLKFPEEFVVDMVGVLYGPKRPSLDIALLRDPSTPHLPKLEKLQWRVDVIISSKYEILISLRHAVAAILREMGLLEQKSLLKG